MHLRENTLQRRLKRCEAALKAQGVIDIKFMAAPAAGAAVSKEAVGESMCHILEAHLAKSYRALPPVNDQYLVTQAQR